jgi:hypothetical protein
VIEPALHETAIEPAADSLRTDVVSEAGGHHAVHDLDGLIDLLERSLLLVDSMTDPAQVRARLLDAFLCAAGITQVIADRLHRDPAELGKMAKYASRLGGSAGKSLGRGMHSGARAIQSVRAGWLEPRHAVWLDACEELAGELADMLWGSRTGSARINLDRLVEPRSAALSRVPKRRPGKTVAIPPRSFFSFDQRPEDCEHLATAFATRYPAQERPLLVIGVRTSGCYLAPVQAAALRAAGFSSVRWMSWRPGQAVLPADRARIRWAVEGGALALVTDDPPTSGGSVARVAADLVRLGVARDNVILLMQVFATRNGDGWRRRLEGWSSVTLDWDQWHVHRLLEPAAIRQTLAGLLVGREITIWEGDQPLRIEVAEVSSVRRAPFPVRRPSGGTSPGREHLQARFDVSLRTPGGDIRDHCVFVKGVGLGFFGGQAMAIASRLGLAIPEVYGVRDGLMYRAWVPVELAARERPRELAPAIAGYVAARAAALPVQRDFAAGASGHDALWEQCSRWLAPPFGRAALPLRPLLHRAGRRLLAPARASLIDGTLGPGRWLWSGPPSSSPRLLKVGWDERAFVYQVPFSYDAAHDIAGAAAERMQDPEFGESLRDEYDKAGGGQIDDVRWFLHRLLYLVDQRTTLDATADPADPESRRLLVEANTEGERHLSALHRGFLAQYFLSDLAIPEEGPLVAIDIDGVLETAWQSYTAPAPIGLLALRALIVHGLRPVLVTGRSAGEVAERGRDYRLPGGVAEYGAALVDRSGRFECLLGARERRDLESLRACLTTIDGVELDAAYRNSIRAFTFVRGRRTQLPPSTVNEAISATGLEGRIRPVIGWAQTDFVAAGVDKGTGLVALASRFGVGGTRPVKLAVGDALPDLAMFALAETAACPANADSAVRAYPRVVASRLAYQAGLHESVGRVIGHAPGGCRACAAPRPESAEARLLITLMAAQGHRGPRKLLQAARAALELV